jgi:hypothetical protein
LNTKTRNRPKILLLRKNTEEQKTNLWMAKAKQQLSLQIPPQGMVIGRSKPRSIAAMAAQWTRTKPRAGKADPE